MDRVRGRRQLHLFLPGPVDRADRVQGAHRCARDPAEVDIHPDPRQLRERVRPRLHQGAGGGGHQLRPLLLQLHLHRGLVGADRPRHRHPRRLRVLALSAPGQRHLSLHHPHHPDVAPDHRDHPDLPHVPGGRPERDLPRRDPALHRLQPAVHHLDDEELLRRAVPGGRRRRAHGRQQRLPGLLPGVPAPGQGGGSRPPPSSASS